MEEYVDAPIFVTYQYEQKYGTKSTNNWIGSWSTSKQTGETILKYPTAKQLIENKNVFYYVRYGPDAATTSRDYTQYDMVASENYHILPKVADHFNALRSDENY